MKRHILKKSEVLREGYVNGLKTAQRIINEMLVQTQGFDNDIDEFSTGTTSGKKHAIAVKDLKKLNERLFDAVWEGDIMGVQKALKAGADVNYKNESDLTPLREAVRRGHTEIVKFLLKRGAEVDVKDNLEGNTALIWAAFIGKKEICKLLLDNGANVNAVNDMGETAYDLAWKNGRKDCCQLLI